MHVPWRLTRRSRRQFLVQASQALCAGPAVVAMIGADCQIQSPHPAPRGLHAGPDAQTGQIDITENGWPVLTYNHAKVEPGPIYDKVAPGNRIYAVARSDYIHPLYGLHG